MSPQQQSNPQAEKAIAALHEQFAAAWNKNDVKGLTSCFAPDGDLINPVGRVARGRNEVEKLLADEQNGRFKGSHFTGKQKNLRFLNPDIAVADLEWEVTGVQGPHSTMKGLATFVLRSEAGKWLIAAARPMVPAPMPQ